MSDNLILQRISILVINQDRAVLDKIKSLINSFGIDRVHCVNTYEEAVEIVCTKKIRFDLVVSTMCLGDDSKYNGVDICRRIKVEDPRTLCLIASDEYSDDELIELLSCNIDGIVDKKNMIRIMAKWISVLTQKKILQNLIHTGCNEPSLEQV